MRCLRTDFGWTHRRYNAPSDVEAPPWLPDPAIFAELQARSAAARSDHVFIHRDFHPGNMHIDGDQLVGIFDWDYACVGPSGEDYARMWLNLAIDHGERIATVFASRAARRLDPLWVAACWLDWLPFYDGGETVANWGTARERAQFETIGRWAIDLG